MSISETLALWMNRITNHVGRLPIMVLMPHSRCNCRCLMCDIWRANKNMLGRSPIAGGEAEVWEVEVPAKAPITQAPLRDVELRQSLIIAIERGDYVRVPGADDQLQAGDTAVVLVQQSSIAETLKLFQPA